MDIDFLEIRKNRGIVAVIETKNMNGTLSFIQEKTMKELSSKLNVPAYCVFNNLDRQEEPYVFKVLDINSNSMKVMAEMEYKNFIEEL